MKATAIALAGLASASASEVSPVEKVISLMEDLIDECEADSAAAAKQYDDFACWCKTTTLEKSESVTDGEDNINQLSTDIQEKTSERDEKLDEVQRRKKEAETLSRELEDTTARCVKDKVEYDTKAADMNKGIKSLQAAKETLEDSKPSLIQMASIKQSLRFAQKMSKKLTASQQKKLGTFLQVDPSDPEYAFHSQGIIDIIDECLTDFQDSKADLDSEWEKTKKNCDDTKEDLENQIDANSAAKRQAKTRAEDLKVQIADDRSALVEAEATMKDDKLYLTDMTKECEARAGDYDQQSQMRGDEITALSKALDILKNKVSGVEGKRAFVQLAKRGTKSKQEAEEGIQQFLEEFPAKKVSLNFLQRSSSSTAARQLQVADFLRSEGTRLQSLALQSLSTKVSADPFKKVKELIQKLIERLITEATEEATKKGFCDTELGKATKERQFRWNSVMKLSAEIQAGHARQDSLEMEIEELTEAIHNLEGDLETATEERVDQKAENVNTMKEAKTGLTAVNQAIMVLKVFYKKAAKASSLLQVEASPIAEDNPGAQAGAYKGKQGASNAILGLLEVIASDFQRTFSKTETEEKEAGAEFIKFERTSKADIAGKTTKLELDEGDLHKTKTQLDKDFDDMNDQMKMVDAALEELEELKPMCIDTGMSYEERVEKREEEIEALKKALCMLDPEGVEPECM